MRLDTIDPRETTSHICIFRPIDVDRLFYQCLSADFYTKLFFAFSSPRPPTHPNVRPDYSLEHLRLFAIALLLICYVVLQ